MDGELLCKVLERIERVARIEPFLILTVAALHLAVVTRGVWTGQLMPDIQLGSRLFKQRRQIALAVGKTIGEPKAVVRLNTLHLDTTRSVCGESPQRNK